MTHLTRDELMDAVEGRPSGRALAHLEACSSCRAETAALGRVVLEARAVDVPEPSPLFWEHFSTRVADAIRAEPVRVPTWWPGWRWAALAPLGTLAVLVVTLVAAINREAPSTPVPATATVNHEATIDPSAQGQAAGTAAAEQEWQALAEIVGPLDWDTADAAGLWIVPGDTELALLDLSDEERRELSRLIEGELSRLKS